MNNSDHLLNLIPWALERLRRGEYKVTFDITGSPQDLQLDPDYGVLSIDRIEEDLKAIMPWERLEKLFALRDRRTPEQVLAALADFPFLPFVIGAPLVLPPEELSHATWSEIVCSAYWAIRRLHEFTLRAVIVSRIGLSAPIVEKLDSELRWKLPDALDRGAAQYVAQEMSELFPKVVERLGGFPITPVTEAVPRNVAQYAREANRCYLYGFFSASLILCRACIEAAVETKLGKVLTPLPFNKLEELLKLAVSSGVLDELTSKMAHKIRRSANSAVHRSPPSGAECRRRLEETREVLRYLYE